MKTRWMKKSDNFWDKADVAFEKKAVKENRRYKVVANVVTYSMHGNVFRTEYCIDVIDKELDGFNLVDMFQGKNKAEANEQWKKLTKKYM